MPTIRSLIDLDGSPHTNVFPEAEPKTVRLTLDAGEQVDPHRHPGREIVFYLLESRISLQLGEGEFELTDGMSHGSAAVGRSHLLRILPVERSSFSPREGGPPRRAMTDLADQPAHWVLAEMGRRVLRPGGKQLTLELVDASTSVPRTMSSSSLRVSASRPNVFWIGIHVRTPPSS